MLLAQPVFSFPALALRRPLRSELRIDVDLPPASLEAELAALDRRLRTPGDALHACATWPAPLPGLYFRHREADGEHFVYVVDGASGRLAGYTVFNRLIEIDRRSDRHVRSPHSKYAPAWQGRGLASAVYAWALARGICLVSGARQSPAAFALWQSLGRRQPLHYVDIRDKRIHDLGPSVDAARRDRLTTRMFLAGAGWTAAALRRAGVLHDAG